RAPDTKGTHRYRPPDSSPRSCTYGEGCRVDVHPRRTKLHSRPGTIGSGEYRPLEGRLLFQIRVPRGQSNPRPDRYAVGLGAATRRASDPDRPWAGRGLRVSGRAEDHRTVRLDGGDPPTARGLAPPRGLRGHGAHHALPRSQIAALKPPLPFLRTGWADPGASAPR